MRKLIARGYQPEAGSLVPVLCVVVKEAGVYARVSPERAAVLMGQMEGGIGVLYPTYVSRASLTDQIRILKLLLEQLDAVRCCRPNLPLLLFIGMQWWAGKKNEALRRLEELCALSERQAGIRCVGLALPGPGKTRTINAVIRMVKILRFKGLAWIDDDIWMEPNCLAEMISRFSEKGCRGAVGATKIPVSKENLAAKVLFHLKQITTPASNYPHGCCILAETRVIEGGIPDRYISDDGYVCFELLDPSLANPLEYLEIVPGARCQHFVGGPLRETVKRIRRMLLNHHIFMADYPLPVARFYFSQILFYGLWPLAPWDRQESWPAATAKWFLKLFYFIWFLRVGAELILRGLVNQPLREVGWGSYGKYSVPAVAAEVSNPHGGKSP